MSCDDMDESLFLPHDMIGKKMSLGGITKNIPRKWTDGEMNWALKLSSMGIPTRKIAIYLRRNDHVGVSIKLKRLSKRDGNYNPLHRVEKELTNESFIGSIKPDTILDLYSGRSSWYHGKVENVVSNDINGGEVTHSMDALKCACMLYCQNSRFDVVDLDPFGSAYECLDLSIKMASKGLCVTLGELGHKRFKRLDFVGRHYNILSMDDFNMNNMIRHIQVIGQRNKKNLSVFASKQWRNIGRVWFVIDGKYSITEQWSKNKELLS